MSPQPAQVRNRAAGLIYIPYWIKQDLLCPPTYSHTIIHWICIWWGGIKGNIYVLDCMQWMNQEWGGFLLGIFASVRQEEKQEEMAERTGRGQLLIISGLWLSSVRSLQVDEHNRLPLFPFGWNRLQASFDDWSLKKNRKATHARRFKSHA